MFSQEFVTLPFPEVSTPSHVESSLRSPYLERNLLIRGGNSTARTFLNPFLKLKIVMKGEFTSQELV